MLLSRRLPLNSLIELCRALRHNLGAGLPIVKVFRQQAERGSSAVRPVAGRIRQDIENGDNLEHALKKEVGVFPPLFLALVYVGERTGQLPEVLGELEKYYLLQQRLWRQFIGQILWPVFQLVAGILVISAEIWILGIIGKSTGTKPLDPLGIGLTGTKGALIFLFGSFGALGGLIALYLFLSRSLRHKAVVDAVLLRIPALGPTLRALALMRFCLALRLTLETGMPIRQALRLSLWATGNAAFEATSETAEEAIRRGDDLTTALTTTRVFPQDFLDVVASAEEGGRTAEVMKNRAEYYEDVARMRLGILARVASFAIWAAVAIVMVVAIIRMYMNILGGRLNPIP
jgi:type IV pilus assembly protein PilC